MLLSKSVIFLNITKSPTSLKGSHLFTAPNNEEPSRILLWTKLCPLKIHLLKSLSLGPRNVNALGDKVFKDVINQNKVIKLILNPTGLLSL